MGGAGQHFLQQRQQLGLFVLFRFGRTRLFFAHELKMGRWYA
jgi:hypothetical protein